MNELNEFEFHVFDFMNSNLEPKEAIANWAMGLSGESGEVTDLLKKHLFHGKELDRSALVLELGDVLWYLTAICQQFDITLTEVMDGNIEKLERRHEGRKFDAKISNQNKESDAHQ